MKETTVYLAARYERRHELLEYARRLNALGFVVEARWVYGKHELPAKPTDAQREQQWEANDGQYAYEDLLDVLTADVFITFTEPPRSHNGRGGRHVELGLALAHAKPIVIVGPTENVFHCLNLPNIERYDTWAEFMEAHRAGDSRVLPVDT